MSEEKITEETQNLESQVTATEEETTEEVVETTNTETTESTEAETLETKEEEKVCEECTTEVEDVKKEDKKEKKNKDKQKTKEEKPKKEKKHFHLRTSFAENYDKLQGNMPALIITCVSSFIIMAFVAIAIFFANVNGPEKVLVPDVTGKTLENALLELQVKELYPTINLRYSENPNDIGKVLEQNPGAGAITKGYSRVSLVISRGVLIDSIGKYVGMTLDEVIQRIDTLFAGQSNPLIKLAPPEYKPDTAPAGTVLEQNPPEGTSIYEPVEVQLVVSRGPNYDNTKAPNVVGQSVNDLAQTIARSKIIFDISYHTANENEKPGTVVSQQTFEEEEIPTYSRVSVEMAMPTDPIEDNYYGIFTQELVDYPYPVPMTLTAIPAEGNPYTLLEFNHVGGKLTVPYAVPSGTTLVLSVANKIQAKEVIN